MMFPSSLLLNCEAASLHKPFFLGPGFLNIPVKQKHSSAIFHNSLRDVMKEKNKQANINNRKARQDIDTYYGNTNVLCPVADGSEQKKGIKDGTNIRFQ